MKSLFLSSIIFFSTCITGEDNGKTFENNYRNIHYQDNYSFIHTFKDKKDEIIGNVYIKYITHEFFSSMLIMGADNKDTLYFIDKTKFRGKEGLEDELIENNENKFFGYKIVTKKNDYITIVYFSNFGNNISDYITIEWNDEKKMFELLKI